jgi:hypothetical protein
MRVKWLAILCTMTLCIGAGTAFAGKAERDMKKKITKEELGPTSAALKTACKCATALKVTWGAFKVKDHMKQISRELANVKKIVSAFCKADEDSRKLYCKHVKSITITLHDKGSPETVKKGKNITIKTCKGMNSGGFKLKEIIEKF